MIDKSTNVPHEIHPREARIAQLKGKINEGKSAIREYHYLS